jgi:hypothetical protein
MGHRSASNLTFHSRCTEGGALAPAPLPFGSLVTRDPPYRAHITRRTILRRLSSPLLSCGELDSWPIQVRTQSRPLQSVALGLGVAQELAVKQDRTEGPLVILLVGFQHD